ncbi:hypothetical protein MBEHAL_0983 [Halarchaeum acidiphilum MH1-52-1]|uniref:Uncharacterized protein n=1 Tax=Halarchaeum acidiphilum MH1-52-1 TaxID=1261545 RepID=U3ABR7_9EURY|nr:hypothetical protein MBEHAL_0983 [Halarchaeum acidiphilum MH1-52-1]
MDREIASRSLTRTLFRPPRQASANADRAVPRPNRGGTRDVALLVDDVATSIARHL